MTDFSWPDTIVRLIRRRDLSANEAAAAMRSIMEGDAAPAQIAAFLIALRAKGETADEIVGLARTMREYSRKVAVEGPVVDTCGTGGDRAGTVNVSTMAALVVAGAGSRVAKHGNRAASSSCGSADLLEALGVVIDLEPEGVAACIEEAGIGFCFAPLFHPAMAHAAPVRRELQVPTVFNFLGPLTNPAGARRQTIGVSDPAMAPKMAEALARLGCDRALVFHGHDGLDELTTTTTSSLWEVNGGVTQGDFDPGDFGLEAVAPEDLVGGGPEQNAKVCLALLEGEPGPVRETVALNAAAGLIAAGAAAGFEEGLARAREAIDSGAALAALERMRALSRRLRPAR